MLRRTLLLVGLLASALPLAVVAAAPASAAGPTLSWETFAGGWNRGSSPAIADVDGNGVNDVVMGHEDGYVRVFKDGTSRQAAGWPRPAIIRGSTPTAIESSPTVADLDKDGRNEIIVGTGSTFVPNQAGGIVVFNADGSTRCRWEGIDNMRVWGMIPSPDGYPEGVFATPAVGDVDGDGYHDIVFGGWDSYIHVLNRNCHETVPRLFNDDTIWASASLFDVDGDGRQEIFVGADSHAGGSEDWPGGIVRALDWQAGRLVQLWERKVGEVVHSSVSIADINGDGRVEVVHGAGDYYLGERRGNNPDSFKVFAWHVEDGSQVPGWPQTNGGVTWSSPTLADVTGDRVPEVIVGSRDRKVYAWRGNGSLLWVRDPAGRGDVSMEVAGSAIVADVTGDGRMEVVIGSAFALYVLDGPTGNRVGATLDFAWSHEGAPAVGNFGPNGWKLVTHGFDTPNKRTRYAAYDIPAPGVASEWPMWRKNARRLGTNFTDGVPLPPGQCRASGNPTPNPSPASGSGYWVLGRDGGVFSFGAAQFHGSLPGIGVRTPARAITPTKSGNGYWLLASDGGVFSFGDARFFGSMGGTPLNAPIISMTRTPTGNGYWLLASDGGVFSFGDARFYGSTGGWRLNAPVISMTANPNGNGYYLMASDGGIFAFGDAPFYGSTGGWKLNSPVISMSTNPVGGGYWLLGGDGGVFSFGTRYFGSIPGMGLCFPPPATQLRASQTGNGYWLLGAEGSVYAMGDARFYGTFNGLPADRGAIDLAVRP